LSINKKNLYFSLKLLVALAAYGYVAFKLQKVATGDMIETLFVLTSKKGLFSLLFVVMLMPVAWFFEAAKWRIALKGIEHVGIVKALFTVWYGVSVGLLTPNRIGEPFGRMAMVEPSNRGKAAILSLICGMAQQLVTIVFGLMGLIWFYIYWQEDFAIKLFSPLNILIILIVAVATTLILFFATKIGRVIDGFSLAKKLFDEEKIDVTVRMKTHLIIFGYSALRYLVFSTQLFILFNIFDIDTSLQAAYMAIFTTYLLSSVIPSIALSEMGIRAGVAIVVVGSIWPNVAAISAATILLWLFNVALPGLFAAWIPFVQEKRR
jgi:hypothetical protein